jgi:hypothetical protein
MQVKFAEIQRRTDLNFSEVHSMCLVWTGEEKEETSVYAGVHVHSSGTREEQGDLGIPKERRRLAR